MTKFIVTAAKLVRSAFTVDEAAARHLEKTYVDVSLRSRLWGI